jgi:DNA-binding beta-propeller fold protein YncE
MSEPQPDRLGHPSRQPAAAHGWQLAALVPPGQLTGSNGLRWGPEGELYVAQAFGSQISAVDTRTGAARIVTGADGRIAAPDDLAFDSHGNLYVTEVMNARVSAIRPGGRIDVIASDVPVANGITIHADRIFMSEFNPEGRIFELFADGSQPRELATGLMMPNALSLGPDGCLYFPLVPMGEIWRLDPVSRALERIIGGLDIPTAVKFDAAGKLHVVESGSGVVSSIDLGAGSRTLVAQVAYGIDNFAFAPDGRLFVSHFTDGEIVEIATGGKQRIAVQGAMTGPFGLAAMPGGGLAVADGMSLAVVSGAGEVGRPAMMLQHGFPGYVRGIAVDAAGAFIVTNSAGQCARYIPGSEAEVLCEGLDQAMGIAIDDAGTIHVCEAGAGRVVAIDGKGARTVASGLNRPTGIAVAPAGSLYVSEAASGRLVHLDNGAVSVVHSGMAEPHGVAVSGDQCFVLDRGMGSLVRIDRNGEAREVARSLPVGDHDKARANVLPGIKDLMPGPLLPFSDIAVTSGGSVAVGANQTGAILLLSAIEDAG